MSIQVIKRNGALVPVQLDKIASKIRFFSQFIYPLNQVDIPLIVEQVKTGLHDQISTSEIDLFTAKKCMEMATSEPEYGVLASRLLINNHHKNTLTGFKDKMELLYRRTDQAGNSIPLLDSTAFKFIRTNQRKLESMIDYQRDYLLDTFGFLTLEKQYCTRINGKVVERPQDLYMREAIATCMNPDNFDDEKALEEIWLVYDLLSTQKFTYATPTLNNSCMANQQMSSCYLIGTEDSLEGILKTLDDACRISKFGAGLGIHVSNLRGAGRLIRGTNGYTKGILNFLQMYGKGADAFDQGGKRKGSYAIFLRDYHPDILSFIRLKNPVGDEAARARSLFLCVMLSDLFWKKVESNQDWHLIDPEEHLGLDELYGEEFERVVEDLVRKNRFTSKMPARQLLQEIMTQQFESGVPYLLNFDHINRKNNLSHYGTVKSSNLCVEICLPSNSQEYAVCNLASMILPSFVTSTPSHGDLSLLRKPNYFKWLPTDNPTFDFKGLAAVVQVVTRTMDRIIDRNHYPVPESMLGNLLHRPIGIGTCGFADACCLLRIPYDSESGVEFTSYVFETISFSAYSESTRLARALAKKGVDQWEISQKIFALLAKSKEKKLLREKLDRLTRRADFDQQEYKHLEQQLQALPVNPVAEMIPLMKEMSVYPSYFFGVGAPASRGQLQPDFWPKSKFKKMWDWDTLREHGMKFGFRMSLHTAQMPTASTAQVVGCNEGAEPYTALMYRRSVLSGEYLVFNRHLINDLIRLGLWNEDLKNYLIASGGSIQKIEGLPEELKRLYRTAWDMGQKIGIDHAEARGRYIDHSQSHNVFIGNNHPDRADQLYKTLLYGWKMGLKTGIYYLRSQPAIFAQQFSIPIEILNKIRASDPVKKVKLEVDDGGCLLCGT